MEEFTMFRGDCPYCKGNRWEFGPRGGAGRMLRCGGCSAEFIWIEGVNVFSDNDAFPRGDDGAHRRS